MATVVLIQDDIKELLLAIRDHLEILHDNGEDIDLLGYKWPDVARLEHAYAQVRNYYPGILSL